MGILKGTLGFLLLFPVLTEAGPAQSPQDAPASVEFVDVTGASGIDFQHVRAPTSEKYLVEVMGSGCAFFDYDADGWLDIFLVNGGAVPGFRYPGAIDHALYRNLGNGKFQNMTRRSGIRKPSHYGMGVAVGDYDNDGFLDLYVTRYTDFHYDRNRVCGPVEKGHRGYCNPKVYDGVSDLLFQNNRDGTFSDVSVASGISVLPAKGLGVVGADLDQDGRPDLYVANDTDPNYLFRNNGDGTFREMGLLAGVALSENGKAQSGMGIGCADYDRDGLFDLAVTNLDVPEYLAVYRNLGHLFFEDVSARLRIKRASSRYVGFGVGFFDFDNDGDLDLFVGNGHINDVLLTGENISLKQPKLLFENLRGRFREVASHHGEALLETQLSRGVAFGDYDNDGDVDVLVANGGEKPALLRNDGGNRKHWLSIRLQGTKSNRNGTGAVLTLKTEAGIQKTVWREGKATFPATI